MARFVTFLSDYGLQDDFVGTCHGVIKRIAPDVQIVDLTHGIPPQNVLHGALVLAKSLEYVPAGVHLAVVDPGVGTARRPLVLEDGEGRLYVGPDNGLLVPAAEALRAHGIEPELVPKTSTQEGLLAEFPRPPGRVLVAAACGARRKLIDGLGADFVPLYDTALARPAAVPEGDVVLLASGSAARSFAPLGADVPAATIGPQTTRVARRLGLRVVAEAPTHDLDGLVEAVRLAERWRASSPS